MGRIIDRGDIKKGDTIVIHREVEVATDLDQDGDFKTPDGRWVEVSQYDFSDAGEYTIELLKRPNPPLPLKVGSVVNVTHPGSNTSSRWMLHSSRRWNSDQGGVKNGAEFSSFIVGNGLAFEVIA